MTEYFEQFAWPLPKGFSDAVASCKFEQGDLLYNTRRAYEDDWDLEMVDWIIHVQAPSRGSTLTKSDDVKSVFEDNWRSLLMVEITDVRNSQSKRLVHTTQGRLYTALRFGNLSFLEDSVQEPAVPLGVDSLFKYLDIAKRHFLQLIPKTVVKPNLFILPVDILNSIMTQKCARALHAMRQIGEVSEFVSTLKDCGISDWKKFNPMLEFRCFSIDSGAPESIRDVLKEAFWPRRDGSALKTVKSVLARTKYSSVQHFSLEKKYGLFVPSMARTFENIRTHSFKHQWFYRYRVHYPRLDGINGSLSKFLTSSFENCPNHVFQNSQFHCSKCKTVLNLKLAHHTDHEIIDLAKKSRSQTSLKERHENRILTQ